MRASNSLRLPVADLLKAEGGSSSLARRVQEADANGGACKGPAPRGEARLGAAPRVTFPTVSRPAASFSSPGRVLVAAGWKRPACRWLRMAPDGQAPPALQPSSAAAAARRGAARRAGWGVNQ